MSDYRADAAPTHYVDGTTARFAYRRFGTPATTGGGVPLVMCMRLRGTIDHWDPAFLDALAAGREVIVFDNAGVGFSSGTVPATVAGIAAGALDFLDALGLSSIDLLGWSMGGFVAQTVTLARPGLVRRLIVAGSNPGKVPDVPASPAKMWEVVTKGSYVDDDFLYLFFPETPEARAAGLASLGRLDTRLSASGIVVSPEGAAAQLAAIRDWAAGNGTAWERLAELTMPVLVANGAHDVMTHAFNSYAMSQRLPNAKVVLYSDAGHGFLFQHPEEFAFEVDRFLS